MIDVQDYLTLLLLHSFEIVSEMYANQVWTLQN
jgi:hypothetical protein